MYGLQVRMESSRGLVTLPAYRALLEEVRALLSEVDRQARGSGADAFEWAVRHEDATLGLTLRVEPFDLEADEARVLRVARAVVGGVHELAERPSIPPY